MGRPRKTEEAVKTTRKPRTKNEESVIKTEESVIKAGLEEAAPAKEKKPIGKKYVVKVREGSWLNIRKTPDQKHEPVDRLENGDHVIILEVINGWGRINDNAWVDMKFLEPAY